MAELIIIAAAAENDVIGFRGKIPWMGKIPADMRRFKDLTTGHPVIMGKKTYDSLDQRFKPLPERKNIVLYEGDMPDSGIYVAHNIREALKLTENQDAFIMGGAMVYKQFLDLATRMELTRIHANFEGDAFFPEIDEREWDIKRGERKKTNDGLEYSFITYNRRE